MSVRTIGAHRDDAEGTVCSTRASLRSAPSQLADANAPNFKDDLHDAHEDVYERPDWALFRRLPTLAQKAGCRLSELAAVVVKELTDNALDAAGTATIELLVQWQGGVSVGDSGAGLPGRTSAEIAVLFSIARPLRSSKVRRLPTRGALGNG